MDTNKLPPALLMALGLSGCGNSDDGTATTGPCLDVAPMTETVTGTESATDSQSGTGETTTGPCLFAPMSTSSESSGSGSGSGSESGSGDGTTLGPCLDAPPPTSSSGSESGDSS